MSVKNKQQIKKTEYGICIPSELDKVNLSCCFMKMEHTSFNDRDDYWCLKCVVS